MSDMGRRLVPPTSLKKPSASAMVLVLLAVYALLVAADFVLRYNGVWVEQDTTELTLATRDMYESGALVPEREVYAHGFTYQAVAVFLVNVCGIPVETLQSVVYPFALGLIGICALAVFRLLTGDATAGALAALLLCMQPELLFVTMRGSHEKFTWVLVMISILLLVKSFSYVGRWSAFLACILLSYLAISALISANVFFASSFTFALAISLIGGWILVARRWKEQQEFGRNLGRLVYVVVSCSILIYVFIFHLYRPAVLMLDMLGYGWDKLAVLLFNFDLRDKVATSAPYAYVAYAWLSPQVYLGLSMFNWMIVLVSLGGWLHQAYTMFVRKERLPLARVLLWLLYAAFAGQLALSMLADQYSLVGTNLQVRLFPAVMLFGIPLAVVELKRLLDLAQPRARLRRVLTVSLLVLAVWFSGASILKATADPVVSNKWLFYTRGEEGALVWTEGNIRLSSIWVGYDERLRQLASLHADWQHPSGNGYDILSLDPGTRYVLFSDTVRDQAVRMKESLPDVRGAHRVYDGGRVQIYQYRPKTPYQR